MSPPRKSTPEELELDRKAWNLPQPSKRPKAPQAPSSVHSRREDMSEPEPEAA
jgi:hypothetical protein